LILFGRVANEVVELAIRFHGAEVKFIDGVADTIAFVARAVSVTSVGGPCHPNSNELNGHGSGSQLQGDGSTLPVGYCAAGESLPNALSCLFDRIVTIPILNQIFFRVGLCPVNANGIDLLLVSEVEDDPLRIVGVVFASERLGQIGIALPIR